MRVTTCSDRGHRFRSLEKDVIVQLTTPTSFSHAHSRASPRLYLAMEKQIQSIIETIKEGMYQPPTKAAMDGLEGRQAELNSLLAEEPRSMYPISCQAPRRFTPRRSPTDGSTEPA